MDKNAKVFIEANQLAAMSRGLASHFHQFSQTEIV